MVRRVDQSANGHGSGAGVNAGRTIDYGKSSITICNMWQSRMESRGWSVGQQCIQCYQKCDRVKTAEDATNSVVIPVILRSSTAPKGAQHYCKPEEVLYNIIHNWRKEVEEVCGIDTPRAREVALCMVKTVVAETTAILQAIWLDQFIEFERLNGCDEWWCDCLQLLGTEEQCSDAARDTIDEVIHGVKRKLKQRMSTKGKCDDCGFKQTMLCPKCQVCMQCCGCNDEITKVDQRRDENNTKVKLVEKEPEKNEMKEGCGGHVVSRRCMSVFEGLLHSEWLSLAEVVKGVDPNEWGFGKQVGFVHSLTENPQGVGF